MTDVKALADELEALADHLEADGQTGMSYPYRKASASLRDETFVPPDPSEVDHVGDRLRDEVEEYFMYGEIERLERLRERHPYLEELTELDGVGKKTAKQFYEELGVETVEDLEEVLGTGEVEDLHGVGPATVRSLEEAVRNY